MTPTLKQLRYFVALAETLHYGRAAGRCHITQPALSMQMRELETTLGTALIERTAHGLVLTAEGEEVARRARDILLAAGDLVDWARHRAGPLTGRLRLGVIPSIGPYLLPRVLPRLHERYPDLELSLRESQTHHLIEDLAAARLDLLILALPIRHEGIETAALFEDVFTLAVHPGHPFAARVSVAQRELVAERLLLLEEGHCLRDQALAVCHLVGADNIEEFRASSLATVVQMVMHGYGSTILPQLALPVEVGASAAIRIVPFGEPPPSRTIGLAWRTSSPRRPDFAAVGDLVTELAHGTVGEGWQRSA